MIDNYISVIKRYSVFSGRAGRKEYWYFYLANIIIGVALGLVMLHRSAVEYDGLHKHTWVHPDSKCE